MKALVFYQNFKINCLAFDKSKLVVNYDSAIFIRKFTIQEIAEIANVPEYLVDKDDFAQNIWFEMNHLEVPEGHRDRDLFRSVGHTSMSVGDFILFEDNELWIAAMDGWQVIHPRQVPKDFKISAIEKFSKRVPCQYPLNKFYNYMDEVPKGTRVSDICDCEKCDDEDCDEGHCLIEE